MGDLYRKREPKDGLHNPSIEDLVAKNAMARLRKDPAGAKGPPKENIDDTEMIASMAKRLSALEKDLKSRQQELSRTQMDNDSLRSKLRSAEEALARYQNQGTPPSLQIRPAGTTSSQSGAAGNAAASSSSAQDAATSAELAHLRSETARLRADCAHAWKQVADMKTFLNDYGLVWVGDEAGRPSEASPRPPRPSPPGGLKIGDGGGSHSGDGLTPTPPAAAGKGNAPRRRSHNGSSRNASSSGAAHDALPDAAHPLSPDHLIPSHGGGRSSEGVAGSSHPAMPFKMSEFMSRIDELNQVAGDGEGKLVPSPAAGGQAHVLHTPEPVRLTIFCDGVQLHRSPPRPFNDPTISAVLTDIMDGYFPGPLKHEFPDGVPIKVIDRCKESYRDVLVTTDHQAAAGKGSNVRSWRDVEEGGSNAAHVNREQFLAKLPQAVIKNGKVIDIRGGVGAMLGAPGAASKEQQVVVIPTHTDDLLSTSQRNHKGPCLPPPSRDMQRTKSASGQQHDAAGNAHLQPGSPGPLPLAPIDKLGSIKRRSFNGDSKPVLGTVGVAPTTTSTTATTSAAPNISTLQIKGEDGQETLIVKLQFDDTIGALRKYIDTHRSKSSKDGSKAGDYEIRSAFPPRKYDDLQETLRDAGLTPNATLFLRSVSK